MMYKTGTTQQDYIFDKQCVLPKGELKLTVLRGDAWVFTTNQNFIVHTGETVEIPKNHKAPTIRRAYHRGFAKVQIELAKAFPNR